MTAKAIRGQGTAVTPGAGGVASSWRGILLIKDEFDSWQTLAAGGGRDAVSFDACPYDSDGFLSASPLTFGADTVPAGSAAVVPAGLAGLYRVSSQIDVAIPPDAGGYNFQTRITQNNVDDSYPQLASGTSIYGYEAGLVIPPGLFRLAEGDAVWQFANNNSTGADALIYTRSWLLVEYLIPWALDDT